MTGVELRAAYAKGTREFRRVKLDGADLRDAQLGEIDLQGASLREANLRDTVIHGADLTGADLTGADLRGTHAHGANLRGANLRLANLRLADLRAVNLREASLSVADLHGANLHGADLRETNLRGADLCEANLREANLCGADVDWVDLGHTVLADLDLSALCSASVSHRFPSTIDHRSVLRSLGSPNLANFLRAAGMPEVFIIYSIDCAKSLSPDLVFSMLQTTFISYGHPDERFARRLNEALKAEGVTTFFFKDDAVPGDELQAMMRRGVNDHDRVVLVCSKASLNRKGLLTEVKETLRREARDGGRSYLIPIVLDDYLFEEWKPEDLNLDPRAVTDRVAADFRDARQFKSGIGKLIKALKKP